ncbi:hypothetical protein UA08_06026 [Talaromyces atroroseus]|uniref:Kinesin motor domain-containing protein n=1 Tax=Talaromyces atroroseus TaxID=1441469 RepID=A0A225AC85_TALAT|nr:hypothetical protein UA08_06026 [Talaromyces atroroseus]OKL58682.1 hypothetical protein UA08_06026 [Talaromyces atroroseus]
MEQFLLDSVPRYQSLVRAFKPPQSNKPTDTTNSSNITVATRIRPMLDDEISSGQVAGVFARKGGSGSVDIHELRKKVRGPPILNSFSFTVDKVFGPDQTTEMIYEDIVQPLVPWVCQGNVGTLFAYGQTGSGKTFTVSGLERLIATSLFDSHLEEKPEVHVCIFELAGNSAHDLLNARQSFSILEDSFGDTQLVGVQDIHVNSASELLQLIERASSFRHTASTEKNDGSSRSHAICRIRVKNPSPDSLDDGILYLVDLAGSEIARDVAAHTANRMKETREINISLSVLKDCIRERAALDAVVATEKSSSSSSSSSSSKRPYIPFRRSALTKVLKHLFDPADDSLSAKTVVLGCINPSFLDVAASKNTLRYAEMLRVVTPKRKQVEFDPNIPTTWTNKDIKNYIEAESGVPKISPAVLAPHESGLQLLRLPVAEFIHRCLQTDGVTDGQAKAFHSKLWDLHIRSQHSTTTTDSSKDSRKSQELWPDKFRSSRDVHPGAHLVPFKERIRPGMVVRWNPPADFALQFQSKHNLAVILCPQQAVGEGVRDFFGHEVGKNKEGQEDSANFQRYLCAIVLPGALADTYEVSLWRQVVIDADEMETEVLLQYDTSTRYYHTTI